MNTGILPPGNKTIQSHFINRLVVITDPVAIQRMESAAILMIAISLYEYRDASWWLFFFLFLMPDLSIAAYLCSRKTGSAIYNMAHNYLVPLSLALLALVYTNVQLIEITLIWTAHIAMDRCLGYGLKYPTNFKHTHLSWK